MPEQLQSAPFLQSSFSFAALGTAVVDGIHMPRDPQVTVVNNNVAASAPAPAVIVVNAAPPAPAPVHQYAQQATMAPPQPDFYHPPPPNKRAPKSGVPPSPYSSGY